MLGIINRKKMSELVVNVEIIASKSGVSPLDLYKKISEEVDKSLRRDLMNIVKKLEQNTARSKVYNKILPKEMIYFISEAEKKGISVGEFFETYGKIKMDTDWAKGKLNSAITKPIVMYILVSLISLFTLFRLKEIADQTKLVSPDYYASMITFNIIAVIILPFSIILSFSKFPDKLPLVKGAYKEIEGYRLLSIVDSFLRNGFSTTDIEVFFRKTLKKLNKKALKEKGMKYILTILSEYLSVYEKATLKVAVETMEERTIIPNILNNKKRSFEGKILKVASTLEELLVFLSAIPIILIVSGVLKFTMEIMSKI